MTTHKGYTCNLCHETLKSDNETSAVGKKGFGIRWTSVILPERLVKTDLSQAEAHLCFECFEDILTLDTVKATN